MPSEIIRITTFSPLFSALVTLFLVAYILGQRRNTRLNRSAVIFFTCIAVICLGEFCMRLPISSSARGLIQNVPAVLFPMMVFLFVEFAYAVIERKRDWAYWIFACLSGVMAPTLLYLSLFAGVDIFTWLNNTMVPNPIIGVFMFGEGFLAGCWAIGLCLHTLRTSKHHRQRQHIKMLFGGLFLALMYSPVNHILFPYILDMDVIVEMSSLGMFFLVGGVFWAMYRYQFLSADIRQIEDVSRYLFAHVEDAIIVMGDKGEAVQVNQTARTLFGLEDQIISSSTISDAVENYSASTDYSGWETHLTLGEKKRDILLSQSPVQRSGQTLGKILMIRDVTEKKKEEKELQKIRQIESLGMLAGGIAHDINNYLGSILNILELIKLDSESKEQSDDMGELLEVGEKAVQSASKLANQLLTFSKGGDPVIAEMDISSVINETVRFVLSGSNVDCKLDLARELNSLKADKSQISQVFQNLMLNALQAMPKGGTIRISAVNQKINGGDVADLNPGLYAKISVTDEGEGISEEDIHRIFDPYFSTKPKGNGIGLTTVFSIIKKHEGHISVTSKVSKGTTFTLYLPASKEKTITAGESSAVESKGGGTVMIMDDEETIIVSLEKVLPHLGYKVVSASEGSEALELYHKHIEEGESFAGFILDLTIPGGMGGKELAEKLFAHNPDLKIIVSSGYSHDPILASPGDYGFSGVLKKPYSLKNLRSVLGDVFG